MYAEARKRAGETQESACFKLHVGLRTLQNYEKGTVLPPPEVIARMAEVYRKPELPMNYCSHECPIGKIYQFPVQKLGMAEAVLKLLKEIHDLDEKDVESELVKIVADGKVDKVEENMFIGLMGEIEDVVRSFFNLRTSSNYLGIKKAPGYATARG